MKFLLQIKILFLAILIWNLFDETLSPYTDSLSFILILIFGIPHGAADAVLHQNLTLHQNQKTRKLFIAKYVLILVAFLAFWFIAPFKALVIFVIASVYHFGQEFFEEFLKNKILNPALYLIWGSFILMVPFLFHYRSTIAYVSELTSFHLPVISDATCNAVAITIVAMNFSMLIVLKIKKQLSRTLFVKSIVLMISLLISYWMLPLLLAFTMYFVIIHSFNSMGHQINSIIKARGKSQMKGYLKDVILFSLIVYAGGIVLYFMIQHLELNSPTAYLLVLVSTLTMPHMVLMQEFYASIKSKRITG